MACRKGSRHFCCTHARADSSNSLLADERPAPYGPASSANRREVETVEHGATYRGTPQGSDESVSDPVRGLTGAGPGASFARSICAAFTARAAECGGDETNPDTLRGLAVRTAADPSPAVR
jgi:hypothetical protein